MRNIIPLSPCGSMRMNTCLTLRFKKLNSLMKIYRHVGIILKNNCAIIIIVVFFELWINFKQQDLLQRNNDFLLFHSRNTNFFSAVTQYALKALNEYTGTVLEACYSYKHQSKHFKHNLKKRGLCFLILVTLWTKQQSTLLLFVLAKDNICKSWHLLFCSKGQNYGCTVDFPKENGGIEETGIF